MPKIKTAPRPKHMEAIFLSHLPLPYKNVGAGGVINCGFSSPGSCLLGRSRTKRAPRLKISLLTVLVQFPSFAYRVIHKFLKKEVSIFIVTHFLWI
jgi:hypothetical protein